MRIRTTLAIVEKRMQVCDLKRHCPLCRTCPAEMWTLYLGESYPISKQPPCPLCGKGPQLSITITPWRGGTYGKDK